MKPILFIHIPKTAGTSFRKAYAGKVRPGKAFCDYDKNSPETSQLVREWIIERDDYWGFKQEFDRAGGEFLTGHFPASRYVHLFGVENTVTFLREPLQRVMSEYEHFVRLNGFTGTFQDFFASPHFINRQSKRLKGVPVPALRFIGLTERYQESLDIFEECLDIKVPCLELNFGKNGKGTVYDFTEAEQRELKKLNQDDITLYENVSHWFDIVLNCIQKGQPLVRGQIDRVHQSQVEGWAVSDNPGIVNIEILRNDQPCGVCRAKNFKKDLRALGISRGGYVGFQMAIPELQSGDRVQARSADTGQPLYGADFIASKAHIKSH